jgi:integrase
MAKITKRFIDSMPSQFDGEVFYWDDLVKGFGVRFMPSGAGSYLVQYRIGRRTRRLKLGRVGTITPDEARRLARHRLADVARGGDPSGERHQERRAVTVAELCDMYLDKSEGRIKASTLAMDRSRIETHVKPLLGHRAVNSITTLDIERMQKAIADGKTARGRKAGPGGRATGGRGVAARTVGMLGTILEAARRWGIIEKNPARGVERYPDGRQRRFLSLDEIALLGQVMRECDLESRTGMAAIRMLLLTGMRRMEVLALPWTPVDLRARCIRLEDSKGGPQLRPLGEAALDLLRSLPQTGTWVFPADRGDGHFVGLPRVLQRLCGRAGLAGVTVHVLRHTFAAVAAEMSFSELTIAGLIGHRVAGVTARYAHVPDAALLTAADRVSKRIATALDGVPAAEVVPLALRA